MRTKILVPKKSENEACPSGYIYCGMIYKIHKDQQGYAHEIEDPKGDKTDRLPIYDCYKESRIRWPYGAWCVTARRISHKEAIQKDIRPERQGAIRKLMFFR